MLPWPAQLGGFKKQSGTESSPLGTGLSLALPNPVFLQTGLWVSVLTKGNLVPLPPLVTALIPQACNLIPLLRLSHTG